METVVKKNNYTKIYLYSGHDTSVTCLMHSLGFSTPFTPDYGASVIFELYVTPSDEYFVKVYFYVLFKYRYRNLKLIRRFKLLISLLIKKKKKRNLTFTQMFDSIVYRRVKI